MERLTERKWETAAKPGSMPPLKNCPFCGGQAETIADGYNIVIRCRDCAVGTIRHVSITVAVGIWNRRVYEASVG